MGAVGHADIPARIKPGLWQAVLTMSMSMAMNGQTASEQDRTGTMVFCSDGSLGPAQTDGINSEPGCTQQSTRFSGDTLRVVTVCPGYIGVGGAMTTNETLVFEGATEMHMEANGASSVTKLHMVGDWKWLGTCPAGMAPGETGQMVGGNFRSGSNMMEMPQQAP